MSSAEFAVGDIVSARGREWIVTPSPAGGSLCLRPLAGGESDLQLLEPALEATPVRHARFEPPATDSFVTQDGARLLAEALRLGMRRGAGPFRSSARLSFEPRAYQIVPLLMALRLPTVRLLIADDVGIGKTIEAAMIVRELMDRGEVDSFAVLCPPHLVEQWLSELKSKFDVDAVAVTASSAQRLERGLPGSQTIFDAYPVTVVSLDYIKAERRRDAFARACPKLVVVDEAHSCVGTHQGRQQRRALLQRLSEDEERHMLLLTATPHSGNEEAFDRLLGLLDKDLSSALLESEQGRIRLAKHFVQRRRMDIIGRDWGEDRAFPKHHTAECPYALNALHHAFHDAVLDYCLGVVEGAGGEKNRQRLAFWGTLALMRCVGSSPAAAISALRNRLASEVAQIEQQVLDEDSEEEDAVDLEPAALLSGDIALKDLIAKAEALATHPDPKIEALVKQLKPLVKQGANPVVFCRFIATADYVGAALRQAFPRLRIEVVTGALPTDERRARVEAMEEANQRLLVATDCLSEGVNLQRIFDTVVHYDLSWNPTRHQQREGRVDRFGQPAAEVRSLLLYCPDSAIDGAVLDVILRKAEAIKKATGVTVPLPEEREAVAGALMKAVLLRKSGDRRQLAFDFGFDDSASQMETMWRDVEEGEKKSRARFAQNAIKPEEVAPEWRRQRDLLGGAEDVSRFVSRALTRLDAPLERGERTDIVHIDALPPSVRERLEARDLTGDLRVVFEEPAPPKATHVHRTHPLTSILAEALMESALDPKNAPLEPMARVGAWVSKDVAAMTTVALLRLRFKLTVHGRKERVLLVEEAALVAFEGRNTDVIAAEGDAAARILEAQADHNIVEAVRRRTIEGAMARMEQAKGSLSAFAVKRAEALAADHARVREAAMGISRTTVEPVIPPDIIAVFVVIPAGG